MTPGDLVRMKYEMQWNLDYEFTEAIGIILEMHGCAIKVLIKNKIKTSLVDYWEVINDNNAN